MVASVQIQPGASLDHDWKDLSESATGIGFV